MYTALMWVKRVMTRVKEKRGNIYVCTESRKATIRNLKILIAVYEYTIVINLSKKGVDIAFLKRYQKNWLFK